MFFHLLRRLVPEVFMEEAGSSHEEAWQAGPNLSVCPLAFSLLPGFCVS